MRRDFGGKRAESRREACGVPHAWIRGGTGCRWMKADEGVDDFGVLGARGRDGRSVGVMEERGVMED